MESRPMTQNIYINAELSAELEELGVVPKLPPYQYTEPDGTQIVDLDRQYTIFCLLYPENAERIVGDGWQAWCLAIIQTWQDGMDWQAFVAKAVERRKAEKW